jgi:predicted nucleotidyltransferase
MNGTREDRIASDPVVALFLDRTREIRSAGARFLLFGSRARGDGRPDSDYDVLVVLPKRDPDTKSRLYDAVMDVLWETDCLVSLKVFDRAPYDRLAAIPTPFMGNVAREGIQIG